MSDNGFKPQPVQKLQPYEFELFNRKLKELYGQFEDGRAYFRLIWSEDEFEKRRMTHTDEGFPLTYPEVRLVRKYRPQTKDRYVLEGLQEILPYTETDLIEKISYEPVWTFQDSKGNYLIPIWPAIHLILETIRANQEGKGTGIPEYIILGVKDTDDPQEAARMKKERIDKMYEDLFGNETSVTDALARKSAITVPDMNKGEE